MKTLFQFSLLIATFTAAWIVTPPKALADQRTDRKTEALFESFETSPPGQVKDLQTAVGRWKAESGQTVIDGQHAYQGKQCLRLTGGEKNSVILHVTSEADTSGVLSSRAERWTKRGPFSFRIEKRSGDRWNQIFDGDVSILVGRAFREPERFMLNCRFNRKSSRVIMVSDDLRQTWQPHPTSQRSLIEPRACMASLIDGNRELGQKNASLLLIPNPNSLSGRNHITIQASFDHGMTWPESHHVLLDEGTGA